MHEVKTTGLERHPLRRRLAVGDARVREVATDLLDHVETDNLPCAGLDEQAAITAGVAAHHQDAAGPAAMALCVPQRLRNVVAVVVHTLGPLSGTQNPVSKSGWPSGLSAHNRLHRLACRNARISLV